MTPVVVVLAVIVVGVPVALYLWVRHRETRQPDFLQEHYDALLR